MVDKDADLIISGTADFVQEKLSGDSSGHDWWHIYRVWKTSIALAKHYEVADGLIVQDADRLDAIGAIGIARTFAYGGYKGRSMYTPGIEPKFHTTAEEYLNSEGTTINHFHEKLLLLKDLMNTEYAKNIAEARHKFMEQFLTRFHEEWEGKDQAHSSVG